jgi:DNA-binding MarR family transcriptional regulator
MRNINHLIQSIKDYKGFKTNAELADFLGVSRSTISNWIARETIDEDLIKAKIPEIRLEFLREGEFPMTEQRDLVQILLEKISRMERKIEQLEKELKDHGKN